MKKHRNPRRRVSAGEKEFRCTHCHQLVLTDSLQSGVNNRNHCPYCLWSRHVDLYKAGDRLSVCRAPMKPVGLVLKQIRKKYNQEKGGELMLIHLCTECGKVSLNRIAADDDAREILQVFEASLRLDPQFRMQLTAGGIEALEAEDQSIVCRRLFGSSERPVWIGDAS